MPEEEERGAEQANTDSNCRREGDNLTFILMTILKGSYDFPYFTENGSPESLGPSPKATQYVRGRFRVRTIKTVFLMGLYGRK